MTLLDENCFTETWCFRVSLSLRLRFGLTEVVHSGKGTRFGLSVHRCSRKFDHVDYRATR